jgi:uncharacterized protein
LKNKILNYLTELKEIEDINILYACESGSRMWGIAFEDSDYDVRFIYHRPLKYYLSLNGISDTIDINQNGRSLEIIDTAKQDNIDIVGWDLKKYLSLFLRSNSVCFEWLNSPIVYLENRYFTCETYNLVSLYFWWKNIFYSYYGLAQSNNKKYSSDKMVKVKKYLYSIRPILVCKWMLKNKDWLSVPLDFNILKELLDEETKGIIDKILKQRYSEQIKTIRILNLDIWIATQLTYLKSEINMNPLFLAQRIADTKLLDNLFYKIVVGDY